MDRRFVTVLGVSLLFALVVSGVFYQFTRGSKGGGSGPLIEQKNLVVAAKPLAVGATIQAEDLKLSRVPATAFPKGGFSKLEDVVERPVISNILLEEPVLEGRLAAKGAGMGLAPVIPAGMRAVSVRVTDVVGVAGFVQPGLRVDVLVTGRPPQAQSNMTATVLQNILVLSSGTTLAADARGQAINAPSVTLLVTPEQAEVLTLASNEGRIQLVLRNSKDTDIRSTPGSSVAKLYGGSDPPGGRGERLARNLDESDLAGPPPARRPKPAALPPMTPTNPASPRLALEPPREEIVLIRGDKRSVETVMRARVPVSGEAAGTGLPAVTPPPRAAMPEDDSSPKPPAPGIGIRPTEPGEAPQPEISDLEKSDRERRQPQ